MNKEELKKMPFTDIKIPVKGDYAFTINDWREENPYIVFDVKEDRSKFFIIKKADKTLNKYKHYKITTVNRDREFRMFYFTGGHFIKSRKIKEPKNMQKYLNTKN